VLTCCLCSLRVLTACVCCCARCLRSPSPAWLLACLLACCNALPGSLSYERVKRDDATASLALLRLQMLWRRSTEYLALHFEANNDDEGDAHSSANGGDRDHGESKPKVFSAAAAAAAAVAAAAGGTSSVNGFNRTSTGVGEREGGGAGPVVVAPRRWWICSPAAFFWCQKQRQQLYVAGDGGAGGGAGERVGHRSHSISSGGGGGGNGGVFSNSNNYNHHHPQQQHQQQLPDLEALMRQHPMVFSDGATPWRLIKVGQVMKRRSPNRLGRWKLRLLYVVEFHGRLPPPATTAAHSARANGSARGVASAGPGGGRGGGGRRGGGGGAGGSPTGGGNHHHRHHHHHHDSSQQQQQTGLGGDQKQKVVFCVTRPWIKELDTHWSVVSRALWPRPAPGEAPSRVRRPRVKADIFLPAHKSSCYQVCV
jgi:hypothetical protein